MARLWKTETPNRANSLIFDSTYFVEVCGFTFRFTSLEQIEEYRALYTRKIHPSSADGAERELRVHSKTKHGDRVWMLSLGDHWERQSRFDRLPLYLREESKRLRVVKALERALKEWAPAASS